MSGAPNRRAGPHTWEEFVALDEDDLRELIDGELVETEVPKLTHERIVATLVFLLARWCERHGGIVLPSGYKIRVSDSRGVMPDVQVYRAGNRAALKQEDGLVRGRPDLVVEVVSASSRRYDRMVKLGYYASLRIPEYWLVDPKTETLDRLLFSKKGYVLASTHEGNQRFEPPSLRGLVVPLARLWTPQRARRRA
jgi:Uma2 family endonuclease